MIVLLLILDHEKLGILEIWTWGLNFIHYLKIILLSKIFLKMIKSYFNLSLSLSDKLKSNVSVLNIQTLHNREDLEST
jgi:hypothetical protein